MRAVVRAHPAVGAKLASLAVSVRHRTVCRISFDGEDWVHRYPNGVVVETHPNGLTASMRDRRTRDDLFYGYAPRRGDTVVDVGAGVGGEVREFSRAVGSSGTLVSVEAHPRIFRCLEKTVELNRLSNVTIVQCAVTASEGSVLLGDDDLGHVGNSVSLDPSAVVVRVRSQTLLSVIESAGIGTIDLLEMNIEGMELPVLEAFRPHLGRVAHVVVGCHDFTGMEWQQTFRPVRTILEGSGFDVVSRVDDPRSWIRCYLYGTRRS